MAQTKKTKSKAVGKTITPKTLKDSATIVPPDSNMVEVSETDPMDTVKIRISKEAITKKVVYTAKDSMPYDAINNVFYLYKDAKVEQEDLTLKADFLKIDINKNLVTAKGIEDTSGQTTGKPLFTQAGTEYKADVIKYNIKTKKGYLSEFRTKEGEGYIQGEDVVKTPENNFGIKDAKYTTCNLEHPHYYIGATKIKVIPEKKIVTGPANLVLEDVRTPLVLPFGIFSIKRGQSSGVVIPTYGVERARGYFLRDGGYYFGLGEKWDYTLRGSIWANGSWELKNGLRYNNRYHYNGSLLFNYADTKLGEASDPEFQRLRNFLFNWIHNADPKARPGTSFAANVNIASVNNAGSSYLQLNSFNPNNIIRNELNSSINFGKSLKGGRYNIAANASMSQNTSTRDVFLTLPNITFTASSFNPFMSRRKAAPTKWYENITINYTGQFQNRIVTKDSILFRRFDNEEFRRFYDTASNFGIVHSAPIQTSFKVFKYYTLSASVTLNEYWYTKTIRKDTFNRQVLSRNVEGFERAFTYVPNIGITTRYYGIKNFKNGKIAAIRHVVNPNLGISYSPDYSAPRYGYYETYRDATGREIKYSIFERGIVGGPGIGRQGNVNLSIDNNIEMKVRKGKDTAQKEEKIQIFERLGFNTSYNLLADSLNLAPVRILAQTRLFKNIGVQGDATLDPYKNEIITINDFKTVNRVNQFYTNTDRKLGVITNASLGINATFNKETFKRKKSDKPEDDGEVKYMNESPDEFYDFNVPWNLSLSYSVQYRRFQNLNNPTSNNISQTLGISGDVNVTPNWKVGYTSGYDLQNKQLTFTSIDFIRLLHCWEFKLNWIPIGPRQSFLFTINVKSSLLQDLRTTRRREWTDRKI